jgi:hypothetical protein
MTNMVQVTRNGTRLEQLRQLALELAAQIDSPDDNHSMAQLARQYRETIAEIAFLEGDDADDELDALLDG